MLTANLAYNKDLIVTRMLKQAAAYWGHSDAELNNFDPLVKILIEACAVEIYKINNEISSIQERMLEKLARLLTPEVYTAPKPAHAIVHARPSEGQMTVTNKFQFFYHKKTSTGQKVVRDSNVDLFFSPLDHYKIISGGIKYYATGSKLLKINNRQTKELLFTSRQSSAALEGRTVWLGLDLYDPLNNLTEVSFYFDIRNRPDKKNLFPLLQYSKWSINGAAVKIEKGIREAKTSESANTSFSGFEEFNINHSIKTSIKEFYDQQFITIKEIDTGSMLPREYPVEFEKVFPVNELAKLNEKLYWIKIQFLPEFDGLLEELTVSINCFPVLNRYINEVNYRLQNNFNIIPLLTTDQFLSIDSVKGSSGLQPEKNEYWRSPFESENLENGSYDIRTGDIERFDERNAVEMMNYLLELLRDESRAFAALGQHFVSSLVKELNQNISQLEQKIKQNISLINQSPTYLLVNPRTEGENVFVEFWTTNGEAGNGIKSGSKLQSYRSSEIQAESLLFMNNTFGGADKLKGKEILNAYKNTLLTRGRVVTVEDIKSFCSSYFNGKARSIEVSRGVTISHLPNEGLISTIDISIVPLDVSTNEAEWNDLLTDLRVKLVQCSAMEYNYRIRVEDFSEN